MHMRTRKPRAKRRIDDDAYVLSIKLPRHLVAEIDAQADAQSRSMASLIRQTLLEKFKQVA